MKLRIAGAVCAALALATPAMAHHSGAMFAQDKTVRIEGTVREYRYEMPHTWISVMTNPDATGKSVRWDIEGNAVTGMKRIGLTPAVLKPGVKLAMDIHPLKDGRNGGAMVNITMGGKVYSTGYSENPYGTGRAEEEGVAKARVR